MGVKIDSRKVRAGEKWIFRKITNMTAGARPLRWVGSYTPPPLMFYLLFNLTSGECHSAHPLIREAEKHTTTKLIFSYVDYLFGKLFIYACM